MQKSHGKRRKGKSMVECGREIKEKKMIRWGIVGAGNIAGRFAASLKNEKDAVLYAISGRNEEKLLAFKEKFPCEKVYVGHENLLADPDIDAVYIALPHHMHREWSVKALQAHKAVLCEKPAVLNEQEMQEIAAVSRKENVLFMEAMKPRFEPAYAEIRKITDEKKLGNIVSVYAENCFLFPREMIGKTYHTGKGVGGALLDSGCYCTNWPADFLEGEPVLTKTYANCAYDIDWYVNAKLQFDNGTGEIVAAFDRRTAPTAVLTYEKGKIIVEKPHRPDAFTIMEDGKEPVRYDFPYEYDDFYGQIHHFCTLLREGKTESPVMSSEDSIRNAHILDVIRTGFTGYTCDDLAVLEAQEKTLAYDSFDNEDALKLGMKIIELQKEYDRGVAVRIVRESDSLVMFQYVMKDKNERNITYAEGKHNAVKEYGHSSAWVNVASHTEGFTLREGVLPSGGCFPVYLTDGTLAASVMVSGLHEGKDHELIVRAISEVTGKTYPDLIKALG